MTHRRTLALTIFVAIVMALGWWQFATRIVPTGQPPVVTIDPANMATLRNEFNAAAGDVRIIALLSPT